MERDTPDTVPASWQTEETRFSGDSERETSSSHFIVRGGVPALDALEDASNALIAADAVLNSICRDAFNGDAVKPEMVFALQRLQLQARALVDSVVTGRAA